MTRTVHLQLTGKAEELLKQLEEEGLTERDVFARALSILNDVYQTKRVGRIVKGQEDSNAIEFLYGINVAPGESKTIVDDKGTPPSSSGMLRIGKTPERTSDKGTTMERPYRAKDELH
jgi:hypothetical protein